MIPLPTGNSPSISRCGVVSSPKRAADFALGVGMQGDADAQRGGRSLARMVVRASRRCRRS
jgi:hypothetical protein